jgi:hypothetical protein
MKGVWQLPVLERRIINELYIKHNAKYHFYVDDGKMRIKKSLCGKHTQFTEEFESVENNEIVNMISRNTQDNFFILAPPLYLYCKSR